MSKRIRRFLKMLLSDIVNKMYSNIRHKYSSIISLIYMQRKINQYFPSLNYIWNVKSTEKEGLQLIRDAIMFIPKCILYKMIDAIHTK